MIAVYINEAGNTASIKEQGFVRVYHIEDKEWKVALEFPFHVNMNSRISEVRQTMIEMVQKISTCKVFVAKEVVGQLYYILETNSFESFEAEGRPEQFLDSVWHTIEQDSIDKTEVMSNSQTSDIKATDREGVYMINLKKVLNSDCSLTSKKLLFSFLQQKEFLSLEVICDHIPKWFDIEFPRMGLSYIKDTYHESEIRVYVTANE